MITVAQLLGCAHRLEATSDSAKRDVEILLCHCLQKSSTYLRTWPDAEVAEARANQFEALLHRRELGEPIAYLTGEQGFWSLDLSVSPATLIPRPETELLVEKSLNLFDQPSQSSPRQLNVLDLGTGTGAIALALASEKPHWHIVGCDIEAEAIDLADKNRRTLFPESSNIEFLQSDWFENISAQSFDLILSNPPYIDGQDSHLSEGDVRFEPRSALVADNNGLAAFELIIEQAPKYMAACAWLLVEHGCDQGPEVRRILKDNGFENLFTDRDLAGLERISGGQIKNGV